MRKIYYWPDGMWCDSHQLDEYCWKSDDFAVLHIDLYDDELIDQLVNELIRG